MNLYYLGWLNLKQQKARNILNILSITIAFLLFGLLGALSHIYSNNKADNYSSERILTINRLTITKPLPLTYNKKISQLENVLAVSRRSWFGGYYKEEKNEFHQYAVDAQAYQQIYPEYGITDEMLKNWLDTPDGIIITPGIARRFDWKVGDTIPIISKIWPNAANNNERVWYFKVVGIAKEDDSTKFSNAALTHFEHFNEYNLFAEGTTDEIVVRVKDAEYLDKTAREIDEIFSQSAAATRSWPENLFMEQINKRYDVLQNVFAIVLVVVFFTILLITGNSISLSVRERVGEFSVLRVLGFKGPAIFMAIVSEGMMIVFLGGVAGLALAKLLLMVFSSELASYPLLEGADIGVMSLVQGVLLMVLISMAATLLPAIKVIRANVADVLRG